MNTETYVVVGRTSHDVFSPVFETVAEADKWGKENLSYLYQEFAYITLAEEVGR